MSLRTQYNKGMKAVNKAMGIGQEPTPKPARRVDATWQVRRTAVDKAEKAFHDAKNAKSAAVLEKKMELALKHLTVAYKAQQKAAKC